MKNDMMETLVRTGPGTLMGNLIRRYWVPALLSSEIAEPDGPQVRVKILGERLLAFRDTNGRVGLVDEFCRHRGASLFLGRNEECGIRCSYHGWKYDISGRCVDLPSSPEAASKVSITAYPCIERAGIVWAYMGPKEKQPEPPEIEWCLLPDSHRFVSKRLQESNYLQAFEGGIDSSHVAWVHRFEMDADPMHNRSKANGIIKRSSNVVFQIEEVPSGLLIFARREVDASSYYWRITQYLFPWFTLIPPFGDHPLGGHMWIPIDDENCWAWSINFLPSQPLEDGDRKDMEAGKGIHVEYIPGTFRPTANRDNDWLIDRKAQKEKKSYSGVAGFSIQDASLQESMGPIQNHAQEFLMPTDRAIVLARRLLHRSAVDLENGTEPPAVNASSQRVRSAAVILDKSVDVKEWARLNLHDALNKPVFTL
ncbi:MAG: aromatic ring-hydroxylating dioxygenase subunit alpha [Xanthobacteraceae bacterium]|nr:aromatic ring-hydroxylating dioxygenase subunit alpha [Xanthobacteraceae bacterium]